MAVPDSDVMSHDEVDSPLRQDQQDARCPHPFSALVRQSSIYSLTLDEFQQALCESGKNFGSMNMDEFLNSIWTAEENQAHAQGHNHQTHTSNNNSNYTGGTQPLPTEGAIANKPIAKQGSLSRQGSLSLPALLCRKTVDEVWSEIHRDRQEQQQQQHNYNNSNSGGGGGSSSNVHNKGSTQRQPTFGEMTLEDFLVKAGVVRGQNNPSPPAQPPSLGVVYPNFGPRSVMGRGGGEFSTPSYQTLPPPTGGESSIYNGKRSGGYPQGPHPSTVNYRMSSGGGGNGGYGQVQGLAMGSPVSPQSDGMGVGGQVDAANMYGMDMSGMRGGRKRSIDGPIEKVVERRQRRMIKNRESAARSRARKQAYTVELEAELNQLKEENAQLKQALAELERKRKQQMWCNLMALFHAEYFEEAKMKAQTKAQRAKETLRKMHRTLSCPL